MIKTKNEEIIHREILPYLDKGASYIDALIIYAEDNNIEIETLGDIIKKSCVLKDRIWKEASDNKTVKLENKEASIDEFI
jgi:hypothetical protein